MEPLDRATVWPYDEQGRPREFVYQRYAHPTGAAAEAALGELEGGEASLYSSGTAAVTACVLALAHPGTTIALAAGAYYGTGVALAEFAAWGLEVVEFDQTGDPPPGADIVWVESPANPFLTVPDWEAVRAHPGLVVCDATASTPVYLRALDEGADVVAPFGDQVPDRAQRRAARGDRHPRFGDGGRLREVRGRTRIERRARRGRLTPARAAVARAAPAPADGDRARPRLPASPATPP